jgi:YidC/Oxa1 family membrane protein insertase
MDKNSISGIVLIMAMLLGYQYFFAPVEPVKTEVVAKKAETVKAKVTTATQKPVQVTPDSSVQIKEQLVKLENKNLIVTLSNFGGKIVSVQLKNYRSYANYNTGKNIGIQMFDASKDQFDIEIPTGNSKIKLSALAYEVQENKGNVIFTSTLASGQKISQTYVLGDDSFELGYSVDAKNAASLITGTDYTIHWKENLVQNEKDINILICSSILDCLYKSKHQFE